MEGSELLGKLADIDGVKVQGESILISGVKFHPNRVAIEKSTDLDGWRTAGIFVQRTQQSNLWWLGDWALAGEEKFGEDAAQFVSSEHFTEAYLRRARWVCQKIAPNRRLKELSFEHHAAVAGLKEPEQDKWLHRALEKNLSVSDLRRAMRKQAHRKRYVEEDFPDGKFRVIYADPPWQYDDSGVIPGPSGSEAYGRAERHYPTMKLDDIKALKIGDITARNCVLFLWVPNPLLPDGLEVLSAWGFTYKSEFVWDKELHNFGHYNSIRHEHLLIGTRGKMVPDSDVANQYDSVQSHPRSEVHSAKPELFREIIDHLYPAIKDGDRVELFARMNVPEGWRRWGNEIEAPPDEKAAAAGADAEERRDEIAEQAEAAEEKKGGKKTNGSGKPRLVKSTKKKDDAVEEAPATEGGDVPAVH